MLHGGCYMWSMAKSCELDGHLAFSPPAQTAQDPAGQTKPAEPVAPISQCRAGAEGGGGKSRYNKQQAGRRSVLFVSPQNLALMSFCALDEAWQMMAH